MEFHTGETARGSRESAGQPSHSGATVDRIFKALVQAAFITLLTVIAYELGVLAPVDRLLFARTSAAFSEFGKPTTSSAVVVEIDQSYFEERFDHETPLDRKELGDLIGMLAGLGRKLVVDLDLSPYGKRLEEFEKAELTCQSEAIEDWPIERALCAAKTNVVLPVPLPASLEDAKIKYQWMRFVCGTKYATFAFPDIPASDGPYTVAYFEGDMTLAGALPDASRRVVCAELDAAVTPGGLPIEFAFLARSGAELPSGFSPLRNEHVLNQKRKLIDFRRAPLSIALSSCEEPCGKFISDRALSNATVFLGGTWAANGADEFVTPIGVLPGVSVHAYASNGGLKKVTKARALLIELVVGFVLVLVFRAIWERADHALHAVLHPEPGSTRILTSLWRYVCSLLMIPLAVALAALAILAVTAFAFSAYVWMAPGALLLGVLAKSYLEREPHVLPPNSPPWHSALVHLPQVLIAAVAVLLLINSFSEK